MPSSSWHLHLLASSPLALASSWSVQRYSSKIQLRNTFEKYISRNTLCSPWQLAGGDHTRSLLSHHQLSSVKTQARKSSESLDQIICEVIFILKIFLTLDVYLRMIIDHPLDSHSCSCIPTLQWRIRKYWNIYSPMQKQQGKYICPFFASLLVFGSSA